MYKYIYIYIYVSSYVWLKFSNSPCRLDARPGNT